MFAIPCTRRVVSRRSINIVARPSDLIGNTPLMYIDKVTQGIKGRIAAKLESLGPCSSVKDRLGRSMIDEAEKAGAITPGKTVLVEPTSGNTGIALAFIARERGYRCILTMPETMSIERRMMLMALGCEVVLTPKETAVPGALAKAHEIVDGLDGDGYMLQQFENPANAKIHRETTGPEIWRDTDGQVDVFVSGVGTGGTVTGVSQYIKEKKPSLHTVAVEPQEQMLITAARGGEKIGDQGPHKIQGMGAGLVPAVLDINILDEVVPVHSDDAMAMANRLWLEEGLPVGVSAGAIMAAAVRVMSRPEMEGKLCVAIVPSFGERYFTHPMFAAIQEKAVALKKQPLPLPFDNRDYGFATARG
jgi:cysteine synthase A